MKADELMVNDWVILGSEKFRVGTILRGGNYSALRPIPLTPEILEKNGFKDEGYFARLDVGEYHILCDTKNVAILHREHTNIDVPIYYVHELQHALRLCKIEKVIVL